MDQAGSVDPEVQGSISNLVSALGGPDPVSQEYKLGDEALACLRDLRKWLQNYDAKYERLEVACAIANTTLVTSDIPQILGKWELSLRKKKDPYLDRVALACLELLVPLTWPQSIVGKEATAEHFSQSMFLKKSQTKYKRAIISHKSHGILRAVIRLTAVSALRVPYKDREPRDEGILTLTCSLFRNILAIDSGDDEDRSTTVQEYERQKVLGFFVTLGAGMGTSLDAQFDAQDTLLLESLYLMLRGVDVARLHGMNPRAEPLTDPLNKNLKQLLETESEMNRSAFKPSRHSRFGTMVAMDGGEGNRISISGQRGVSGSMESTLSKLDENKKWHRPTLRGVSDEHEKTSYMPAAAAINNDADALKILRQFVADFLDSSYNPLFVKLRRLIERQQTPRVSNVVTLVHYCYLIGWFIDAERTRAHVENRQMDYQLVGGSLSKSSFGIVMNLLRRGLEPGELRNTDLVHAAMVCFRQILTTIRDMSYSSGNEELREAADGMKSRLFYEETWLNLLSQLPRTSHRKSLAYASETVAVTHIILKMLDEYSKQHTVMFVRMKQRRSKKPTKSSSGDNAGENGMDSDEDADAENSRRESVRVTNERKFSFDKFVLKYINGPTIDTYERILSSYREISEDSILQVFSFLRRTFAKTKCRALFYRMSLMRLLLNLVGHHGLLEESKSRKVADQFLKYYVQKFVETANQMPSLHIQINESMTPADAFYYDHGGRDKEKFKPPKYEFTLSNKAKQEFTAERQIALLVAALIDIGKEPFLKWTEQTLTDYLNKNESHSKRQQALTMDKDRIRTVHNDALLRLFLRSLGLVVNTTIGQIIIPSSIDELVLIDQLQWISKYQNEAVEFEGGKMAMDFIKIDGEADHENESDGENHFDDNSWAPGSIRNDGAQQNELNTPEMTPEPMLPDRFETNPAVSEHSLLEQPDRSKSTPVTVSPPKRSHYDAFALEPSDDDNDEALSQSIAAIRRRKAIDDDDED